MKTRKFPTYDEAITYLSERGKLEFFGRVGDRAEIYIYKFTLHSGKIYRLNVYQDGNVEVRE